MSRCPSLVRIMELGVNRFRYFDESENKIPLMQYLCQERVLKNDSGRTKCLSEKLQVEDNAKSREEL